MGPNVATPELFAEALFTDTSSWTVIDRGPFEALQPITVSFYKQGYFSFRLRPRGGYGWTSRPMPRSAGHILPAEATSSVPVIHITYICIHIPFEFQVVLEHTVEDYDPASPGKAKLEVRAGIAPPIKFLPLCCCGGTTCMVRAPGCGGLVVAPA